ncbi:DNA-binding protein [candidate division WOR-3 bacterium]|nr:DNA-binding protein [candidate division WOR-3 bacterium]
MSFNWIDLLRVAADLLKKSGEEYYRSSINRAYYGVFGKTRQRLKTEEKKIFQPPNVHKQVIDYFKKNNDNLYRQIGYDLDRLRKERVKADYKDDIIIKRDTALKVHTWAEKLKTDLAAI